MIFYIHVNFTGLAANWSDPNKKADEVDGRAISTFFPDPDEIRFIQVSDSVPVSCSRGWMARGDECMDARTRAFMIA